MSAEKAGWTPRLVVSRPVGERAGRVVAAEVGVVTVISRRQRLRATLGAALLEAIAQDGDAAPRVGDRVQLRTWSDGPVTVERILARKSTPGDEGP